MQSVLLSLVLSVTSPAQEMPTETQSLAQESNTLTASGKNVRIGTTGKNVRIGKTGKNVRIGKTGKNIRI